MHLTGNGEDVLLEVFEDAGVGIVVGQAVEQGEVGIINGNALFQYGEDAVFFHLAVKPFQNQPLPVGAIAQFVQFFSLSGFEEAPKLLAINGKLTVKVSGVALLISSRV